MIRNPKRQGRLGTVVAFVGCCAFHAAAGNITYTLQRAANPTADQQDAYARITKAMDSALVHYNGLTNQTKALTIQYNTDVATADASFSGNIRFGASRSYMSPGTAMHEIAHALGSGTTQEYKNLIQNGVFTGPKATAKLREITNDPAAVLKGDAQHFWPLGLNYASEIKSEKDLVDHCRLMEAILQDMFHEEVFFQGRVKSRSTGQCMVRAGGALALGSCTDSTSKVRIVAMGDQTLTYRLEFGNQVLDLPNESKTAGTVAGLYGWNGGNHQRVSLVSTANALSPVRLRMVHSDLILRANGTQVVQDVSTASPATQDWELVEVTSATNPVAKKTEKTPGTWVPRVLVGEGDRFDLNGRRH